MHAKTIVTPAATRSIARSTARTTARTEEPKVPFAVVVLLFGVGVTTVVYGVARIEGIVGSNEWLPLVQVLTVLVFVIARAHRRPRGRAY